MSCVRHCADLVTSTERQEPIQKCFRSLEFISKFIVQSRQLFSRATQGQNEDGFRMDVHLVFNSFNKMLSISYETVLPAQILFLEHISATFPHFLRQMPTLDLAKLITLMFDSVAKDGQRLMHAKLIAILHAVNSRVFEDDESRALILPTCCEHVRNHLVAREELRLCLDILGDIISFLKKAKDKATKRAKNDSEEPKNELDWECPYSRDINVLVEIIMRPLIEILISMEKEILSTVMVCNRMSGMICCQVVANRNMVRKVRYIMQVSNLSCTSLNGL